jgi:hypothetical protein
MQDYFDCPRRFRLRNIERLAWPAVESEPITEYERRQQEGSLFHRLVQQHLLGLPAEKLTSMAVGLNLKSWWNNYLSSDLGMRGAELHPELTLSAPLRQYRLLAKFDLVAMQAGNAVIFDWKTSARRPRQEWPAARWQTRVYRAVLAMAGAQLNHGQAIQAENIRMIYWFTDFPAEAAEFQYDVTQLNRDWSALEAMVDEIAAAVEFPMTEDLNLCRFCVFRSYCDRGHSAANAMESDADPEDPGPFEPNLEQISETEF